MPAIPFRPHPRNVSKIRSQAADITTVLPQSWRRARDERKEEFLRQSPIFAAIFALGWGTVVSLEFRRTALQEHKYQIGQTVYFTSRPIGHMVANSTYEVVRLLPSDGADFQYRIKNPKEAFERVARESQLEYSS
jgi:hypothetical protein